MATSNNSSVTLIARGNIKPNRIAIGGGRGGVSNYELLSHKPSINGHELIGNKTNAELGIPTDTQDLTNTAGFITNLVNDLVNYYTKLEIDDIITQIKQSSFRIVDDLPLVGEPGVIYLILNATPQSRNYYDEYIYIDNRWEKIGTTEIDLSGYVTDEELTQVLRNYITNNTLNETLRNYYNKADVNEMMAGKADVSSLAPVATSGSYDDLTNKPDIPDDLADLNEDSTHRLVTDAEKQTWDNKSDFSGSYNDLTDKPDIPIVNNSTITIQKNNQNIDSFTLNQSNNKSINIDVPEKTSDIQNDSGFITNTVNNLANYYLKSETYTKTEVSNLINAAVSGRFQKVNALPAQGEANVIYLVPKATVLVDNIYDEYIWEDDSWELIGDTQIDLSGYVTDDDLTAALQNYVTSATFNATISNYYTKTEVGNLLANKVDKVDGKGLSTYDYDAAAKGVVDGVPAALNNKVDKDGDKVLSTNDYTDEDKDKLDGISDEANKVESSETNGNIQIDGVETTVYNDTEVKNAIDDIDDIITTDESTIEGNPINFTTKSAQKSKSTIIDIEPIQDLHGYDKPWVGGAGKNVLPTTASSTTISGVTFTVNSDGTVIANASSAPSENAIFESSTAISLKSGTYIISGCPSGGSDNTYACSVPGKTADYGSGGNLTLTSDATVNFRCIIYAGYKPTNLVFKPMICLSTVTDPTSFEPYSNICPISGHDQINVLGCGKNLLHLTVDEIKSVHSSATWTGNSTVIGGITFTILTDEDGNVTGIKANGITTGTVPFRLTKDYVNLQFTQNVVLNGYDGHGWNDSYLQALDTDWTNYTTADGEVTILADKIIRYVRIRIPANYTVNNQIFYPMLRLASDADNTFEPYQQSNNLSIDLPSTVYGGVLDLESGELVVDRKLITNLPFVTPTAKDVNNRWICGALLGDTTDVLKTLFGKNWDVTTDYDFICDKIEKKLENECVEGDLTFTVYGHASYVEFRVRIPSDTYTAAEAQAFAKSCTFIYYVDPYTLQLTPHQLSLLKAQNNLITSQYTQIKVTYRNGVFATLEPVSEDNDGLMSRLDKVKLDSIADDATKTESSTTNGNIKINGAEVQVYNDSKIKGELSTDTTTIEGNPLNFSTLSAQKSKSTILSLEPIQDLHGFTKPWVGGAGKNLLPMTVDNLKAFNTSGSWSGNTYTKYNVHFTILTDTDNNVIGINVDGTNNESSVANFDLATSSTLPVVLTGDYIINGCPTNGSASSYNIRVGKGSSSSYVGNDFGNGLSATFNNEIITMQIHIASGATVSNKVFQPMIRLSMETDATFEPYTNIASISGRSKVDILGCGKNLCPTTSFQSSFAISNANMTQISGCHYKINGSISGAHWIAFILGSRGKIPVDLPKGTYTVTASNPKVRCYIYWDEEFTEYMSEMGSVTSANKPIKGIKFLIENTTCNNEDIYLQLEQGNVVTPYEPYIESTSLQIQLGQTVYGGQLDVENGVLVVDKVHVNLGDLTWGKTGTNQFYAAYINDFKYVTVGDFRYATYFKCSNYNAVQNTNVVANGNVIMFRNESYSNEPKERIFIQDDTKASMTTTEFKSAMDGVDFVYELATPIIINLTPHTIKLLEGVNNISTDGDGIKLTYRNGKFATLDGAVPKMTFRGEDYTMGVDDIGLFLENLTKSTKTYIADPLLNFDGTVATYKKIMKQWFINNGVNIMDSTGITYLCERWYEITKQGWKGGTSFPAVGVSTGSTGTRFDDNVGMSVTPSTDTSANTDTYQGLPLFAITDCNWELDSDGNILITAIDGITDNFVRDDPTKFVGVMQQTGWVKKVDDASTQKYYYADDKDAYEDLVPLPEAIKLDGTVRSFVVHAKYMSGIVDSKMTCCSGIIPRRNISHDGLVTLPDNIGTQYSGGTSVDWSFLVWMQRIKYASLTSDGVLQGCCNYNYQYYVKVSETGVKRLILSSANGANLKVGSTVTFGAYAGNADRGQAATYSISGQDGAIITAIEDVTIDSTTYKAIYVDTTNTFDTVANGDATNGTTIVSTHHWVSGSCDNVKGNDGSPVSATNGVYPAKLQGIEYMVGGYEVFADVIMNISDGYYNPYYARKSTEQATSITSSMVQSTLKCAQPASDGWRYIQKHGFDGEIFYPILTGTSSSEYMKDAFYENGTGTTTGTREWLAFGSLHVGSGFAGLSCLNGFVGLGAGGWFFVARLSCNGNRGILLTA